MAEKQNLHLKTNQAEAGTVTAPAAARQPCAGTVLCPVASQRLSECGPGSCQSLGPLTEAREHQRLQATHVPRFLPVSSSMKWLLGGLKIRDQ